MGVYEAGKEQFVIILPDNTALCFTAARLPARERGRPPRNRGDRMRAFVKSFLPEVVKVDPVDAVLQSGRRVVMVAPPAFT